MSTEVELPERTSVQIELGEQFTERLEASLRSADRERRRRSVLYRARMLMLVVLLAAPIVGWHLLLTGPDGVHITLQALAWLTFLLDIAVHVDGALLSYLGLQALPTVVGILLLILVTGWLLSPPRGDT